MVEGLKGKDIVGIDVGKLLDLLNRALADEWLAYYQYWVGAKIAVGPMRNAVVSELSQHASEELGHAELLVGRILQLGGTPILEPRDWYRLTNCGYEPPTDPSVVRILEQNIKAEQCAIKVYNELAEFVKDKDVITYNMAVKILEDEVEHEFELQSLLEDIRKSKE
ncbi:MAG: ferritin-like domain-containing protein [Thaumarchaeota archaeon]|nr:ferritin-like domain-containing protein [Nitrososphaerota archaeon]